MIKYEDWLLERLKDPIHAAAYLNVALKSKDSDSEELLLMALQQVAKAYGFTEIANKSKLGRESLYKSLSKKGNPKITTLLSLLRAMGLRLSVQVSKKSAS